MRKACWLLNAFVSKDGLKLKTKALKYFETWASTSVHDEKGNGLCNVIASYAACAYRKGN